jgi:hypothetical protein
MYYNFSLEEIINKKKELEGNVDLLSTSFIEKSNVEKITATSTGIQSKKVQDTNIPAQLGGFIDGSNLDKNITENLYKIITLVDKVNSEIYNFKEKYNKLILQMKRVDLYNFYLKVLVYNSWDKQNYVVFNYINRGLCQYYFGILDDIVEKFNHLSSIDRTIKDGQTDIKNPSYIGISYLNRYHYITVMKLYNFFKGLLSSGNFTNSHIIDISTLNVLKTVDPFYISMKMNFLLFNSFKDILDSFKETFQNRVTIYARINDRQNKDDKIKMFIKNKDNQRYLDINTGSCKPPPGTVAVMIPKTVKFNEVFDTKLDTSTISKYMTMASQITKGKGVVIMTYGYSGTGKTFTLFGKYNQKPEERKQGILQSTLSNILGVKKIFLRVYELYGKGIIYNEYWDNPENLDQSIFSYDFDIVEEKETVDGKEVTNKKIKLKTNTPEQIKNNNDILNFFKTNKEKAKQIKSSEHGYTLISNNDEDTKNIFQSFSEFIDEVDAKRKNGEYYYENQKSENNVKRITETPNNPESSRSILFYEFYIQVENQIIPFIIIDLPGREEIIPSYCDAHIKQVKEALEKTPTNNNLLKNLKQNEILYKTVLSSYVLNPLALKILFRNENSEPSNLDNIKYTTPYQNEYNFSNKNIISFIDKFNIKQNEIIKSLMKDTFTIPPLNQNEKPKLIKFNYDSNMFEGIYINENIMGLTKILTDIIKETKKDYNSNIIEKQNIKISEVKDKINEFIDLVYIKDDPSNSQSDLTELKLNKQNLEKVYNYNNKLYNTKRIYRESNPIIQPIINKYNKDEKFIMTHDDNPLEEKDITIKKVDSYKLFYLLTNDDSEKKCFHQYELLENTLSLINAIRN